MKKLNDKIVLIFLLQRNVLVLVFHDRKYLILAVSIFTSLFILLSTVSQFVFFSPQLVFYVPVYGILSFSLIVIIAALSGLVVSMNIFKIRTLRAKTGSSGIGFFGSIVGASAGVCGCSSIGFSIISVFGSTGATASAFLTNYEIPLRLIAIGILVYSYYITAKVLTAECKIQK